MLSQTPSSARVGQLLPKHRQTHNPTNCYICTTKVIGKTL